MSNYILLFPDGGSGFLNSAKLSLLCSERVFTLAPLNDAYISDYRCSMQRYIEETIKRISSNAIESSTEDLEKDSFEEYIKHALENSHALAPAVVEGHVVSLGDQFRDYCKQVSGNEDKLSGIQTVLEALRFRNEDLNAAFEDMGSILPGMSGTFASLVSDIILCALCAGDISDDFRLPILAQVPSDPSLIPSIATVFTFLLGTYASIIMNLAIGTWDNSHANALARLTATLKATGLEAGGSPTTRMGSAEFLLGTHVLKESVPNVTSLSVEQILEIRSKRGAEFLAFQDGLRLAVASQINAKENAESEVSRVFETSIRPAIAELRRSILDAGSLAKWNLLSFQKDELQATLIPVSLSMAAGVAPATASLVGGIAVMVKKLSDFMKAVFFDRNRIRSASNWTFVYDLQAITKR